MRWVLRLIATGEDDRSPSADLMEICRPEGLVDITNLGLTLPEAAVLPVLRRKMPPEGLAWASHRDVVRQSGGAASPVSVPCLIAPRRASIGTLPKCGRRGSRDGRISPGLPEHALNPTPAPVPSPLGIPKLKAGERLPLTAVAESDHRWG
jgi:hypothetical protein